MIFFANSNIITIIEDLFFINIFRYFVRRLKIAATFSSGANGSEGTVMVCFAIAFAITYIHMHKNVE